MLQSRENKTSGSFSGDQTASKVSRVKAIRKLKYGRFSGVRYRLSFAGFPPAFAERHGKECFENAPFPPSPAQR